MSMIVNRRDLDFILYETLGLEKILESAHYADYDRESLDAMLDLCQTVAEDQFLSCAAKLDANEPIFVDGKVETIPGSRPLCIGIRCRCRWIAVALDDGPSAKWHVCLRQQSRAHLSIFDSGCGEHAQRLWFASAKR